MDAYISVDFGYGLTLTFLISLAVPHYRWSWQDIGSKLWGWIEADYQAPPKGIYDDAPSLSVMHEPVKL